MNFGFFFKYEKRCFKLFRFAMFFMKCHVLMWWNKLQSSHLQIYYHQPVLVQIYYVWYIVFFFKFYVI